MNLPPFFINELPNMEFKQGCVWLQLASGTGPQLVVPRSVWRHFLEGHIRQLNEIEAIEQEARRIVNIDTAQSPKRGKRK